MQEQTTVLSLVDSRSVTLRPVTHEDTPFLFDVYRGTRQEEMARTGWDSQQIDAFLRMQFDAQNAHYSRRYPDADYSVIYLDETAVGRVWVARLDDEIRILTVALLPEYRNCGIGTQVLQIPIEEAREFAKPVRIYVERSDRSIGFFRRNGFKKVAESGLHDLLERSVAP